MVVDGVVVDVDGVVVDAVVVDVVLTSWHSGTVTKFNLKLRTKATVKSC